MRTLVLGLLTLFIVAPPAFAQWQPAPLRPQAGSSYDVQSGNMYNWNRMLDGSTNVRGFNPSTGSQWNTTILPNGNQRGVDSQGRRWNYNSSTGSYMNTDGTMCVGKGAA